MASMLVMGGAMAADFPVKILSAQQEVLSKDFQEYMPDYIAIVVIGESDTKDIIVGDIQQSYEFGIFDVKTKDDVGQANVGFAYLLNDAPAKVKPNGKYRFVLEYNMEKSNAKSTFAFFYNDKQISNAVKVEGVYKGAKF